MKNVADPRGRSDRTCLCMVPATLPRPCLAYLLRRAAFFLRNFIVPNLFDRKLLQLDDYRQKQWAVIGDLETNPSPATVLSRPSYSPS